MNISTRGLKKVSQDDKKTVLKHPDGHTITIAHSKLKTEHAAALLKLPMHKDTQKFADGGEVQSDDGQDVGAMAADTPVADPAQSDAQPNMLQKAGNWLMTQEPDKHPVDNQDALNTQAAPTSTPETPLNNVSLGAPQTNDSMVQPAMPGTKGIDNAISGYNTLAKNEATTDAAVQPDREKNTQDMQNLSDTFQSHFKDLQEESQNAYKAFAEGKIDPNHYMNSLSSGGRTMTAIGLILGGIGGGMTHQANPALEFLNKQIDRDIDAQKANMGKQATLFSMASHQMGSEIAGTAAAKGMMTDALISKIQAEAAKHGGSDAMAKAAIAIAPLQMQKDQYMQQAAMMKSAHEVLTAPNSMHSPAVQGQATRMYLRAAGAKPEEIKASEGELAEVQGLNKIQENMQDSFAKLRAKVGAGILTPGDADALRQTYGQQLQVQLEHRYNHDAAEQMVKNMFPRPLDRASTLDDKLKVMGNIFDASRAKSTPTLNSYGIPVPKPKPMGTKVNSIK